MKWPAVFSIFVSFLALAVSCFQSFIGAQSLRDARVSALLTRRIDACAELRERARYIHNRAQIATGLFGLEAMQRVVPELPRSTDLRQRQADAVEALLFQCSSHPNAYTLQLLGPEPLSEVAEGLTSATESLCLGAQDRRFPQDLLENNERAQRYNQNIRLVRAGIGELESQCQAIGTTFRQIAN